MLHNLDRRTILKVFGCGVVGSGAVVGAYGYGSRIEAEWLKVEKVTVPVKHLESVLDGFKIVQMSDFHLRPHTKAEFVAEAVSVANGLNPDLIALTGDYVTGHRARNSEAIFDLAPVLATLNAKYGVFTILGNHDYWTNETIVLTGLKESGLPALINSGVALSIGQQVLYLAGLDDGWLGHPDLSKALEKRPGNVPTILLVHEPDLADIFSADGTVSLQLSGHSHGGQIRLPGIGALILPRLGRKYDQGLYRVKDMWVYTTRGIGVVGPPIRINCRPEITEITLVRA